MLPEQEPSLCTTAATAATAVAAANTSGVRAFSTPQAGCTACVAVVRGSYLVVANVGDSRCVVCEAGGHTVCLTRDHKPAILSEHERIRKVGWRGEVGAACGLVRAQAGGLCVARWGCVVMGSCQE
jgi:serine/threonine protein phosphatase PrpC